MGPRLIVSHPGSRVFDMELATTSYGVAAREVLARQIATAKDGDPFLPVAVVVPSNAAGVAVRRELGRTVVSGGRCGVINVDFLTLSQLANKLGGSVALHRRHATSTVVAAAVRAALAENPGVFAPVRDHPATERTLVAACGELHDLDAAGLGRLAATSQRAADVVAIFRQVKRQLAVDWYHESDVIDAAVGAVDDGTANLGGLSHLLIYLPQSISAPYARLLSRLDQQIYVGVIAGSTGLRSADIAVADSLRRLGLVADSLPVRSPPHADHLHSASDPDEEVRSVVRMVVEAMRQGVTLDAMAILYPVADPYARLLHEQLSAAGIPVNGQAPQKLAESVAGRTLLGLLRLPDCSYRRSEVLGVITSAPVRNDGMIAPAAAWERVSRAAGVVLGADSWASRLERYASDRRADAEQERAGEAQDWKIRRNEREAEWAEGLNGFVGRLIADTAPRTFKTWQQAARWTHRLIVWYLGDDQTGWPEAEIRAFDAIVNTVNGLSNLDGIGQPPTAAVLRRTLEQELASSVGHVGHLGGGVLVANLGAAIGLCLERVFVVGAAEGVLPRRAGDDSLLPDRERHAVGGALALRSQQINDDHRRLLAIMASSDHTTLVWPRGDLRRSTERLPSRWVIKSAEALGETELNGGELPVAAWHTSSHSHIAGILAQPFPASFHEYNLRALLMQPGDAPGSSVVERLPNLARGYELVAARSSSAFTRFDGNLAHIDLPDPTAAGQTMSPTRLEAWGSCPHQFLFRHILRVDVVEDPEEGLSISPMDAGQIVHGVLDKFITEILARPTEEQLTPGECWTAADLQRITQLAEEEFHHYESRGLTGRRIFWHQDRAALLRQLHSVLAGDNMLRAQTGSRIFKSELRFGMSGGEQPAVQWGLPDGRTLRFRGSVDRIDQQEDGGLRVLDYKTGSDYAFKKLSEDEPDQGGTKLQLPIYAMAARAAVGQADAPVFSAYWFTRGSQQKLIGYQLTDAVQRRFDHVFTTMVDGIAAGMFIAHPTAESRAQRFVSCHYCDPDGGGTQHRYREWLAKMANPEVRSYLQLADPATAAELESEAPC